MDLENFAARGRASGAVDTRMERSIFVGVVLFSVLFSQNRLDDRFVCLCFLLHLRNTSNLKKGDFDVRSAQRTARQARLARKRVVVAVVRAERERV